MLCKSLSRVYIDAFSEQKASLKYIEFESIDLSQLYKHLEQQDGVDISQGASVYSVFNRLVKYLIKEQNCIGHRSFQSKKQIQHLHKLNHGKISGGPYDYFEDSQMSVVAETFESCILNHFECLNMHKRARYHVETCMKVNR